MKRNSESKRGENHWRGEPKEALEDLPEWALRSDLSQLKRRLEIIAEKETRHIAHKTGESYKVSLKRRISEIEAELRKRKRVTRNAQ